MFWCDVARGALARFVTLARSCRTIYSLAWHGPAGLTHAAEQDRRWISVRSRLPLQRDVPLNRVQRRNHKARSQWESFRGQINQTCFPRKVCGNAKTKSVFLVWGAKLWMTCAYDCHFSFHDYVTFSQDDDEFSRKRSSTRLFLLDERWIVAKSPQRASMTSPGIQSKCKWRTLSAI